MSGTIIQAKGVFKSYKMGTARVEVLKGVDLEVDSGEFLAVVGGSGSGKSTMLHILGALDGCDKGEVIFDGRDISRFSGREVNRFRNSTVGFIFQFYHLLDELNVLENVMLARMAGVGAAGWLKERKGAKRAANELIERVGLSDRAEHKPYQLSGGERQRAAIARALMNSPRLLLADEPTGNLDSKTGNGILGVLEQFHRDGQTIIMVTHDQRQAERAQRTVRLADGIIEQF
jgi:ABC-type lipoprotein export system ATPase subunit